MSGFIPKWVGTYVKTASAAFVAAVTVAVTTRDMYERNQWDTVQTGASNSLRTGDVVLISNRWFTLQSYKHKLYSFFCKFLMKTAWDDCGVVICDPSDNDEPYVLIVEYDKVKFEKLRDFCENRKPRGVAVRQILAPMPREAPNVPNPDIFPFVQQLINERKCTPFGIVRAAWQNDAERAHYRWAVESSEIAFEIRQRQEDKQASEAAIKKMIDTLHDRIGMGEHYAKMLGDPPPKPYAKLFNASLVAEVLQEMGLLRAPHPLPFRMTPVDFAWRVPMINVSLASPKMVYSG